MLDTISFSWFVWSEAPGGWRKVKVMWVSHRCPTPAKYIYIYTQRYTASGRPQFASRLASIFYSDFDFARTLEIVNKLYSARVRPPPLDSHAYCIRNRRADEPHSASLGVWVGSLRSGDCVLRAQELPLRNFMTSPELEDDNTHRISVWRLLWY